MIKRFGSLFAGHIDLDDMGQDATPANDRRYDNDRLATVFEKTEKMAVRMDELGYDAFWLAEHHFQHEGYECIPNLPLFFVHLAHLTKRLWFGCGFNVTTMWHPLRLAEDFATADILTKGRVIFGVGRGYHTREVETLGGVLMDGDEPLRDENGVPRTRAVAVPVSDGEIIDTWHVVGLRGTGSFDFEIDNLYVPAERTVSRLEPPAIESPLYRPRFFGIWSHTVHAGCTLGIARGAIDELRDLASGRGSTGSRTLLRDRERVQRMVGEAEAIVRSARAYLLDAVAEAWEASEQRVADPTREIANVRLAITHAGHESARAVDIAFSAAGTNAAHTANRLERYFRDAHVAVQHAAAAPANYEGAGRVFLGLPSGLPGW